MRTTAHGHRDALAGQGAHRVARELEHGLVWINTAHRNDPSSPWGGMKESGIGRENGIEALESCTFVSLSTLP